MWIIPKAFSQVNCAFVNVYIIPYGNEPFVAPDLTPDYLRVHAETKIYISDERLINKLYEKIINLKKEQMYKMKRWEFDRCRVIIDFVKGNYIYYSITISDGFLFIIDEGFFNNDIIVYKENNDFMCYLKSLFPYFIETLPMINCK